jgi:four helix bundle protein
MDDFREKLKGKMDDYAHLVYKLTKEFPKEEIYGVTSQIRRSFLSVVLNYVEGFARGRRAVKQNFWQMAYGSLAESKYLLEFSFKENLITEKDYKSAIQLAEEIGAMLYRSLKTIS